MNELGYWAATAMLGALSGYGIGRKYHWAFESQVRLMRDGVAMEPRPMLSGLFGGAAPVAFIVTVVYAASYGLLMGVFMLLFWVFVGGGIGRAIAWVHNLASVHRLKG